MKLCTEQIARKIGIYLHRVSGALKKNCSVIADGDKMAERRGAGRMTLNLTSRISQAEEMVRRSCHIVSDLTKM